MHTGCFSLLYYSNENLFYFYLYCFIFIYLFILQIKVMKIGQGGLIVMQLILMSLKISKNIYIFFMQQLFCDMCTGLGGSPKHLHLLLFFQALFIIASIRNVTEWVWAERFEQTAHLWGTEQKWTSTYIICSVNSHKDATTPSHYDDNTHILNIIVICVSSVCSYTLPTPFH